MKINSILALLAIVGGISAAFTNHSARNNLYPSWKYDKERIQGKKIRYISATHLADLLYQKEQGIIILDLRNEKAYDEYHIPSAVPYEQGNKYPDKDLSGATIIYGIAGDDQLNEISKDLPGKVYVLKGGIDEWYSLVLFPDFIEYQVRNNENLKQIVGRSMYFGGSPRNTQLLNITVRESHYREGC